VLPGGGTDLLVGRAIGVEAVDVLLEPGSGMSGCGGAELAIAIEASSSSSYSTVKSTMSLRQSLCMLVAMIGCLKSRC
jgi:hypothetical protein